MPAGQGSVLSDLLPGSYPYIGDYTLSCLFLHCTPIKTNMVAVLRILLREMLIQSAAKILETIIDSIEQSEQKYEQVSTMNKARTSAI